MYKLRRIPLLTQSHDLVTRLMPTTLPWSSRARSSRITMSGEMIRERLRQRSKIKPKTPCYLRVRRSEYKCLAYQEIVPDQCNPEMCHTPIDVRGYAPSDKMRCRYQRTWCEFMPSPRRKKRLRKIYPKRERRNTKVFEKCTACGPEDCDLPISPRAPPPRLFKPVTLPWPCCKHRSIKCRSIKPDGRCPAGRPPSCCVKRQTPYLSFSECKKFQLQPPIVACECDMKASLCDVWNFYRTKR